MISADRRGPEQCLALDRGMIQLGIDPSKVVGFFDCSDAQARAAVRVRRLRRSGTTASRSRATRSSTRRTRRARRSATRLTEYDGNDDNASDPWYSATFSLMLTIAQFMNAVGYDNLTPEAIAEQAANFKGPLLLGGPVIHCGKYPESPGSLRRR